MPASIINSNVTSLRALRNLTCGQILRLAPASMVAQTNQLPNKVLSLLG